MGGPAHPGVGVGDRMPHRVDGQCGGHLEFGGPLELRRAAFCGSANASARQILPMWSSSRAYCSQLCRGHESSSSRASVTRAGARRRNHLGRCRPSCAATECGGCAAASRSRASAARRGRNARRRRRASRSTELIRPKYSQHRDTSCARSPRRSPDRPRGPGSGLRAGRPPPMPPSPARISFSPWPSAQPRASARAPARRSHGSASASRPVSTQNRP